jgi:hypothetical protein
MSDFSLLYKKYNSVSNLTNDLNNSVITLKRRVLSLKPEIKQHTPNLKVSDEEVAKAKAEITLILSVLKDFYNNQNTNSDLYELMDNQLFKSQVLNNVEFKNQILEALNKIKNDKELSKGDLLNIDKFISILDNEAAVLFRKLRTSRG